MNGNGGGGGDDKKDAGGDPDMYWNHAEI